MMKNIKQWFKMYYLKSKKTFKNLLMLKETYYAPLYKM